MLYRDLRAIADRDPDQEVRGLALPVLRACLVAFREHAGDDPVVGAVGDLVSPEVIADGHLRAVDAVVVVGQLAIAIGPENPPAAAPPPNFTQQSGLFSHHQQS
jgi:hypothetical protein